MASISADCWGPVKAGSPVTRHPRVTTGYGSTPTDGILPIEGDIHIHLGLNGKTVLGSNVYDKDKDTWFNMGSVQDNQYWGHGYGGTAATNTSPVVGEAYLALVSGAYDLKVWDGNTWVDPTDPITAGDEYIDIDTGDIYALKP
jgi:hypothetical protein